MQVRMVKLCMYSSLVFIFFKNICFFAGGKIELFKIDSQSVPEDLLGDNVIIMQITTESLTDELAAFDAMLCKLSYFYFIYRLSISY